MVSHAPSGFACGGLLVVSELLKVRASLWGAVLQPEEQEDDMERFADDDGEDNEGDLKKDAPSAGACAGGGTTWCVRGSTSLWVYVEFDACFCLDANWRHGVNNRTTFVLECNRRSWWSTQQQGY